MLLLRKLHIHRCQYYRYEIITFKTERQPVKKTPEAVDIVIIGAGQAGLAAGYYLKLAGIPFIMLDSNPRVGDAWRQRWDSLELFTPRPFAALPGLKLGHKYANYPKKDEIADYFETYAKTFHLPIKANSKVLSVTKSKAGYLVQTSNTEIIALQIIIATGPYTQAYIPKYASKLHETVYQIHSSDYKNPAQLIGKSVTIVGGGNSAIQLAEELLAASKDVTLVSSRMPWFLPKTILGISSYWWFYLFGILHASANTKISKYVQRREDGIIGRSALKHIKQGSIKHLVSSVTDATDASLVLNSGENIPVAAVLWATGFKPNYAWLKLPGALGEGGQPIHSKGISPVAGLYWIGLPWQTSMNSGIINGVGHDARHIVNIIKRLRNSGVSNMDDIKAKIVNGQAVLLDVRTDEEWHESHAAGAIHIPLANLASAYKDKLELNQTVYLYCGSGKRAGEAKSILDAAGYTAVNIGGLTDWIQAGGDVQSKS